MGHRVVAPMRPPAVATYCAGASRLLPRGEHREHDAWRGRRALPRHSVKVQIRNDVWEPDAFVPMRPFGYQTRDNVTARHHRIIEPVAWGASMKHSGHAPDDRFPINTADAPLALHGDLVFNYSTVMILCIGVYDRTWRWVPAYSPESAHPSSS